VDFRDLNVVVAVAVAASVSTVVVLWDRGSDLSPHRATTVAY